MCVGALSSKASQLHGDKAQELNRREIGKFLNFSESESRSNYYKRSVGTICSNMLWSDIQPSVFPSLSHVSSGQHVGEEEEEGAGGRQGGSVQLTRKRYYNSSFSN